MKLCGTVLRFVVNTSLLSPFQAASLFRSFSELEAKWDSFAPRELPPISTENTTRSQSGIVASLAPR